MLSSDHFHGIFIKHLGHVLYLKDSLRVYLLPGIGVFWGPEDERNIAERLWGDQTNQRAELWAAIRGSYPYGNSVPFLCLSFFKVVVFQVSNSVKNMSLLILQVCKAH